MKSMSEIGKELGINIILHKDNTNIVENIEYLRRMDIDVYNYITEPHRIFGEIYRMCGY